MENSPIHNVTEIFLIKLFFRILVAFSLLVTVCIIAFNINDSVRFKSGEIIAEVPQLDYKAPFEGIPVQVLVKEGQQVKKGDTLMVLNNEQVQKSREEAGATFASLQKIDTTISELIRNTYDKIENLKRERILNERVYHSQKAKMQSEFKSSSQKAELNREKLQSVALARLKMDSALYREKVISKLDITNSFDTYLNYKNTLLEAELARDQIQSNSKNLDSEFLKTQNALDMKLIELNEQVKGLTKEKAATDKELKNALENLNYQKEEAAKQYIISELNGEVMNLYNLRFTQNFVNKGDLLLSVVPRRDKFYAKVSISQRDIRYVKVGQDAHLKVEAFDYFEKGILKGEVIYVPEGKPKEDFFVIIELKPQPDFALKAGYALKGEVIIERLKIYRFILKKLFRKLEGTVPESLPVVDTPAIAK